MKKLLLFTSLFICFIFTSCNSDILDIPFNTTITREIPVIVGSGTTALNNTITLSLDNEDTNKYLDKLKSVKIKKMTYKIIDFNGDAAGQITATILADGETLHTITNVVVKNAFDAGTVYEVTNKDALIKAATSLLTNKNITLKTTGQTQSETSMNFKIKVTLELGVVANPI